MSRNLRVIALLVLLIIIPFLIYAYLQLSSLKEDEQMADEIYEKQMDAILFSLNQYADDMMGQWIRQLNDEENDVFQNASDLILANESIQLIFLKQISAKTDSVFLSEYVNVDSVNLDIIKSWYTTHEPLMDQLSTYLAAGFQKIQAADDWQPLDGLRPSQGAASIMFYDRDSVLYNSLIVIETTFWAEQILGSRMVELARDNFHLAVMEMISDNQESNILYSTGDVTTSENSFQRPIWILPNTYLMIRPQGETYSALIRSRNQTNFYFLLFSVVLVLIGSFLIVRNIRNMMRLAQLKSDFVSNVSHEIRTPISLIRMYAETLLLGRVNSEEKKQHYYDVIHHQSGRLTYLVNNILDFSRIEANRKTYAKEEINLNSLAEHVYKDYEYTFREKKVTANIELISGDIPVIIDPAAFEEALSNLIDNGIKYSEEDKEITITTSITDDFGECSVKDNGKGVSKKEQQRIFDKFYRVEGAMTQKTKGTGLGLSLVKHIMDAHNGHIDVKSESEQGSIFTLRFPLNKNLYD